MDTKYELYLYGGKDGKSTTITSRKDHGNYKIKKLSYEKGLYSPNSVQIEISVSGTPTTDINTTFASKSAQLKVSGKDDKEIKIHQICTDYIVYKFRIVSSDSTKTVHLTLFSRDKLLTLDKFSRVYLNQRLGLDIIGDSLAEGGILGKCQVQYSGASKASFGSRMQFLQFLHYTCEVGTGTDKKLMSFEAIQPYRVQYNEDFYSFISRVACQCGEALFFEDGALTLGPDPSGTTPTKISDADIYCIEYPAVENSQLTVNDYHRDFFKGDDAILEEKDGLQYSDCTAFDEYYDTFKSDSLPDSTKKEFYWPDIADLAIKDTIPFLGIARSGGAVTGFEKLAKAVKDAAAIAGRYAANSDYVNKKYAENVFDNPGSKTNNYIAEQQKSGVQLCQFADVSTKGQIKHNVLADIRKMEMDAAKQKITVQVKTSSFARLKLKLGSRVNIPSYKIEKSSDTSEGTLKEEQTVYIITACRGDFLKAGSEEKDVTEIEVVPLQGNIFVPPYNKCAEFTPVQPQPAIVSDDSDPRTIGRVRIRYPWQIGEMGSPWVRVLTPFSSESGCIHFQPKKKDEVMIGYVGGNIERPYVIGSLFGKDPWKIHDNLYLTYNDTIRVGSQRLDFREGSMSSFVSSFWPAWGFATQFAPSLVGKMKTNKSSAEWNGLTRLTDANSFWKIEGNTATRAVTIDSAWGKVTISAYSGINIEAVGDVTIKGMNINIKAQNNVSIESGIALKNARKSTKATYGQVAAEVIADFVSDFTKVDLSFFRTIWHSIVPPKEGTLKIKSNRYLMLEAGKGTAFDDGTDEKKEVTFRKFVSAREMKDAIALAIANIDEIYKYVGLKSGAQDVNEAESSEKNDNLHAGLGQLNQMSESEINIEKGEDQNSQKVNTIVNEENSIINSNHNRENVIPENIVSDIFIQKSALQAQSMLDNMQVIFKEGEQEKKPVLEGNPLQKYMDFVDGYADKLSKNKQWVFQEACKKYLGDKGFSLGGGTEWKEQVKGLTYSSPAKTFLKSAFLDKTLDTLSTGSGYDYSDKEAQNLSDGKIIASFEENKSLKLGAAGDWELATDNSKIQTLKDKLSRTWANEEKNQPLVEENIIKEGEQLNK